MLSAKTESLRITNPRSSLLAWIVACTNHVSRPSGLGNAHWRRQAANKLGHAMENGSKKLYRYSDRLRQLSDLRNCFLLPTHGARLSVISGLNLSHSD